MINNYFIQVLRNNNFLKIWISQILSQTTINLINFVIVLRIFEATHSVVAVSLVWIFYAIPALIFGPFSGTIVDLVEKRKILVIVTLCEAAIVLLYLLVKAKLWPIYSVIFLYSLVNQLYFPAEGSTLASVVPKKLFPAANSLFIFTFYGVFLLGYGIAGTLIRAVGHNIPFIIGSVFLALASVSVYLLPRGMKGEKEEIDGFPQFWKKVTEGYEFLRENREVLYPFSVLVLANVIVGIFTVLTPFIATEILAVTFLDLGYFLIMPVGLGVLFGALWVVFILKYVRRKWIITSGFFLLSLALLVFSLVLPILSLGKLPVAMVITFFLGVGFVSLLIPAQTAIQEKTPEEFRGRVFGILGFLFTLAAFLPILLIASIVEIIGLPWVMAILALALAAAFIYSLKEPYLNQTHHV